MKYYEVEFLLQPYTQDAADILAALAAETGFETFEEMEGGLRGYIQQAFFAEEALQALTADFPMPGTTISYTVSEAEDKDWNEQWEQEGFDPIVIRHGALAIHDGRHLPEALGDDAISVEIDARLAFGTGTHETTQMICEWLLDLPLKGLRVLDAGCGTGILGIVALKLGASHVSAYDIDEWSSDNTRHNAIINQVDDRLEIACGDASVLEGDGALAPTAGDRKYDVVLANINRNILLGDLPRFRSVMKPGATLIMSGFYTEDIPLLEAKAASLGLTLTAQKDNNHWASVVMKEK